MPNPIVEYLQRTGKHFPCFQLNNRVLMSKAYRVIGFRGNLMFATNITFEGLYEV